MFRNPDLLQQMLELNEAIQRKPGRVAGGAAPVADDEQSRRLRRQLVRDISERREAGESFGTIANVLNQRGLRGEHGGRWYGASVRTFLLRTQAEEQ